MSDVFEMDVNGDGVDDVVVAQEYADGSVLSVADTDGDGVADIVAYDAEGDGVPDEIYDANDSTHGAGAGNAGAAGGSADYASDYSDQPSTEPSTSAGYTDAGSASD